MYSCCYRVRCVENDEQERLVSTQGPAHSRFRRGDFIVQSQRCHRTQVDASADDSASMENTNGAEGSSSASGSQTPAGFNKWRSSLAQFTGLGLTPDEKLERERRLEDQGLERDWNQCEKWKKQLMESSTSSGDSRDFVLIYRSHGRLHASTP